MEKPWPIRKGSHLSLSGHSLSPTGHAAAVAVPVPVAAGAAGVLHDHALPAQILAVQLVNGIVGVAGVLKLHEAVTVFEVDLEQAAVAAEETLDVLLPDMVAQTADVHARHIRGRRGREGERGGKGEEKEENKNKKKEVRTAENVKLFS